MSPGYPQLLFNLIENWRFPHPPPQVQQFTTVVHSIQETVYLLLSIYYKEYFKGYKLQTNEEMHRPGRILRTEASVPVEMQCATLPPHRCVHQTGISSNSVFWDFY